MLIKDIHPSLLNGQWVHAENIVFQDGQIFNEPGTDQITDDFGVRINGEITLNEEFIVFIAGAESGIYRVQADGTTTCILQDDALNFDLNNPIWGVFQRNYKSEVIIAWWDGVTGTSNPPRTLNIDNIPFELNPDCSFVNVEDVDLLRLSRTFTPPKVTLDNINNAGGSLKTGNYSVFAFYETEDGSRSTFEILGNMINIYLQNIQNYFDSTAPGSFPFQGNDGGVGTNKSIDITLTDIDTKYKKVGVGLISIQNGVVDSFIETTQVINSDTMSFTLTGNEQKIESVSFGELFVPPIYYTGARSGTVFNKELYLFNLKIDDLIYDALQSVANDITVNYYFDTNDRVSVDYRQWENSYINPTVVFDRRTYIPGEVYSLYAGFVTDAGEIICHIPGREHRSSFTFVSNSPDGTNNPGTPGTTVNVSEKEDLSTIAATPGFNWENLDQALLVDSNAKVFQFFDTSYDDAGDLYPGYWENADEVYPDNFPDFAGQNVRHHRMPDQRTLVDRHGFTYDATDDKIQMPIIGLKFSNINIPVNLQGKVKAVKFYYATRSSINSTVQGNSMLTSQDDDLAYANLGSQVRAIDANLLITKESLSASYVKGQYYKLVENDLDFILTETTFSNTLAESFEPLRKLDKIVYAPYDTETPDVDNTGREEVIYMELNADIAFNNDVNPGSYYALIGVIMKHNTNLYLEYFNQELTFTGGINLLDSSETIVYGGDGFVTPFTHRTLFPDISNEAVNLIPIYSILNHWLRETTADGTFYPFDPDMSPVPGDPNPTVLAYNYDYSKANNFFPYIELLTNGINEDSDTTRFPYRIARSSVQGDENIEIGWRTFLANDYYEVVRRLGEGVAIRAMSKTLMIQLEYGLLVAVARDRFEANDIEINLGSGEIFQSPPDEIVPEDSGYFGSRHQGSCKVTKIGYVAVDDIQGKICIFDGSYNEISVDNKDFFLKYAKCVSEEDNPYLGKGWITGYDEEYDRLLFTKWFGLTDPQSNTLLYNVFTVSYNVKKEERGWISFHTHAPNMYMFNRSGLFSVRNKFDSAVHKHNVGNPGSYFEDDAERSFIDYVISAKKLFTLQNVTWKSFSYIEGSLNHDQFETIDGIMVYNDTQCTGEIDLVYPRIKSVAVNNSNVKAIRNNWFFSTLRDIVVSQTAEIVNDKGQLNVSNLNFDKTFNKKLKITGEYVIIRLIWENESTLTVRVNNINITLRKLQI